MIWICSNAKFIATSSAVYTDLSTQVSSSCFIWAVAGMGRRSRLASLPDWTGHLSQLIVTLMTIHEAVCRRTTIVGLAKLVNSDTMNLTDVTAPVNWQSPSVKQFVVTQYLAFG